MWSSLVIEISNLMREENCGLQFFYSDVMIISMKQQGMMDTSYWIPRAVINNAMSSPIALFIQREMPRFSVNVLEK